MHPLVGQSPGDLSSCAKLSLYSVHPPTPSPHCHLQTRPPQALPTIWRLGFPPKASSPSPALVPFLCFWLMLKVIWGLVSESHSLYGMKLDPRASMHTGARLYQLNYILGAQLVLFYFWDRNTCSLGWPQLTEVPEISLEPLILPPLPFQWNYKQMPPQPHTFVHFLIVFYLYCWLTRILYFLWWGKIMV